MSASVRRRFALTVGTNLLRSAISFLTGLLLARWLGPAPYGDLAFLLGTFLGIRQLLDMGTSSAFFTFLSQRPRSRRFVRSYFFWLTAQFLLVLGVVGLLLPTRWVDAIWHGEQRGLVLLAFAAAFMQNSVWPAIQQAGESQRQTQWVQTIGVLVGSFHLLAVALLWWLGLLGLYAIFAAVALEYLLAALVAHQRYSYAPAGAAVAAGDSGAAVFRMYLRYCLPMVPYAWVGFAYEFADRWLLQSYGGGVEQAYFAVGSQFAAVALIATTSILRIFWKEIAEAHHQGDHARAGRLYQKVSRLLFLVGAAISGFFMPWADELLREIVGAAYAGGAATLAVMFLYPVHQSMGQIGGTMLYATERVSLYVITGTVFMCIGIMASYLIIAPATATIPGLGLASFGLALKTVGLQIVQVNVIAFIIARIWKWNFDWTHQPISLLGCIALGWIAKNATMAALGPGVALPVSVGLAGVCYLLLVALLVYSMPGLAGLTRDELAADASRFWRGALRLCGH